MKKVFAVLLAALAMVACNTNNEVVVESIILDQPTLTMKVGDVVTLNATVTPEGAAAVEWESQMPAIASVTNGVVSALAKGSALIVAKAGGKVATCVVTVTDGDTPDPQPAGNEFAQMLSDGTNFYVFLMGDQDFAKISSKAHDYRVNGDYIQEGADKGKLPADVTCTLDIWNTDVSDANFGTPSGLNAFGTNDPTWLFWRSGNLSWGNICGGVRQWREVDLTGVEGDYEFVMIVRTPATQGQTSVTIKFYSTTEVEDAHDKACGFNTEGDWKAYKFKMSDLFAEGLNYSQVFTNPGKPNAQGGVLYTPAWVVNGTGLDLEICAIFIYKPATK